MIFVHFQYSTGRMWFGRDVFGRRSLLWHLPSEVEDFFAVTSVAAKDSLDWEHSVGDADKDQLWKEIPAVGVFYVDLKKLFSEGVVSSLWCCPWIQGGSLTYIQRYRGYFEGVKFSWILKV